MIENKPLTDTENENAVTSFLQTNGPSPGEFEPDAQFMRLLNASTGLTPLERESYLSKARQEKQNLWQIENIAGIKKSLRLVVKRAEIVEEKLEQSNAEVAPIIAVWSKWLSRKKRVWHVVAIIMTLFFLPLMALLAEDVLKAPIRKWLHLVP